MKLHTLTITLLLASGAVAQSVFVPDSSAGSGTCNVIPFGHNSVTNASWVNQKYQTMITTTDMGSATVVANICDLAFAPCVAGIRRFGTIEIVMGQTTATTLSPTFSANLVTNVKTVLKATNYAWHNPTPDVWTRIGLDENYLYLASNGNLVVQITVTDAWLETTSTAFPGYRRGTRQRVEAHTWTGTPPLSGTSGAYAAKIELVVGMADLNEFGDGCKGSNGVPALTLSGNPTIDGNGTLGISVANCVASAPVLHVFGIKRFEPRIDLAILGAPGCHLYQTIDILLGGVADASGVYAIQTGVPKDQALLCFRIYTQAFPADANANGWGRTASNYGRILPGN